MIRTGEGVTMLDVTKFRPINVADTCAVWNVLSARGLYREAIAAGCAFCTTRFVVYECLHKPRKVTSPHDDELQQRLRSAHDQQQFQAQPLSVEDLQDVALLERRNSLGKGELSSIAFAKKIGQAFLTDDRNARKLGEAVLSQGGVQTTPQLLGWLTFRGSVADSELPNILAEHERLQRPLRPHFQTMFGEGMRCRHMASTGAKTDG